MTTDSLFRSISGPIFLGAALLAMSTPARARFAAASDPTLSWHACDPSLVGGDWPTLDGRLECATLRAPLDHRVDDGRHIDVGVVRVKAAVPARREGAIFVNIGGPGGNPAPFVPNLADYWQDISPDDSLNGGKRALSDRYDLVAVIPRGLRGGWELRCLDGLPPPYVSLAADLGEKNWQMAVQTSKAVARACTAAPEGRYVNTEQHVHDMDAVRRALGDDSLSFYGSSYGGKVGAWYGAIYPQRLRRMLLDSTMYFVRDYAFATTLTLESDREDFMAKVAGPVAAAPARYGMGADAEALARAVLDLPTRARASWAPDLTSPARLVAALTMGDWIRRYGNLDRHGFETRIGLARFSSDPTTHARIRAAATALLDFYFRPPARPSFHLGPDGDSVRLAVACNDALWYRNEPMVLAVAVNRKFQFPTGDGDDIAEELICTNWGGQSAREPDLDVLKTVPAFLMVQADGDVPTPLRGAQEIVRRFPNAHLAVATGTSQHGLYNFSETPCIERLATAYLLDGELPREDTRTTSCAFVPTPDAYQM